MGAYLKTLAARAERHYSPNNSYELATDTIYVVDDSIRYQTFAAVVSPK